MLLRVEKHMFMVLGLPAKVLRNLSGGWGGLPWRSGLVVGTPHCHRGEVGGWCGVARGLDPWSGNWDPHKLRSAAKTIFFNF